MACPDDLAQMQQAAQMLYILLGTVDGSGWLDGKFTPNKQSQEWNDHRSKCCGDYLALCRELGIDTAV